MTQFTWSTLYAGGGDDCDAKQEFGDLESAQPCTKESATSTPTSCNSGYVSVSEFENKAADFRWTANSGGVVIYEPEDNEQDGWKTDPWVGIYINDPSVTSLSANAITCSRDQCYVEYESTPGEASAQWGDISVTTRAFATEEVSVGKTPGVSLDLQGAQAFLDGANEILLTDSDGHERQFDDDCNWIDQDDGWTGKDDIVVLKNYIATSLITIAAADDIYHGGRPDHPEDLWYQNVAPTIIICENVYGVDRTTTPYTLLEDVVGFRDGQKAIMEASASSFVLLHEIGHTKGFFHCLPATNPRQYNNIMCPYWDSGGGQDGYTTDNIALWPKEHEWQYLYQDQTQVGGSPGW